MGVINLLLFVVGEPDETVHLRIHSIEPST